MAFFAKGSQYLASFGTFASFAVPLNGGATGSTGTTGPVTVGFHLVSGSVFASSASIALCPGSSYIVQVDSGGSPGSNTVLGGPSGTSGPNQAVSYPLVTPTATNLSTQGLAIFTPAATNTSINLGTGFTATLATQTDTFVLTASSFFNRVGYSATLTSPLNNCSVCKCPSGSTCGTNGVCSTIPAVCTATSLCGDLAGKCQGSCAATNSACVQGANGLFSCVATTNKWWMYGLIIAGVILVIIFFGIIIYYATRPATPTSVVQRTVVKDIPLSQVPPGTFVGPQMMV